MKIVFFGDSITRGYPGASFFDILQKKLSEHALLNEGRGGERAFTLYQRVKRMAWKEQVDISFLWVGVNDLIFNITDWFSPFSEDSLKQSWDEVMSSFRKYFGYLLKHLSSFSRQVFAVPPLFIGEDLESLWHERLEELAGVIREATGSYKNAEYLDLRGYFISKLREKESSVLSTEDVKAQQFEESVSVLGAGELRFTIDGVHLNEAGAQVVADFFFEKIKEVSGERGSS
jgi:lysophospholipase L1-like esterase